MTLTVNSLGDSGTGSGTTGDLRYCITLANQNNNTSSTPDQINFAPGLSGTDTLQQGELYITDPNLVINGPGANNLAISGGNQSRVFEVAAGTQVQLSGMTIENGYIFNSGNVLWSTYGYDGGGILNWGKLTLNGDTLSGNNAGGYGGGLANEHGGTVTVTGSTVSGNSSSSGGGGIYNAGTMTLSSSTVTQNWAEPGGGIYNDGGTLMILDHSVVSGNDYEPGVIFVGGDVYNLGLLKVAGGSKIGVLSK
jgi:hypothetical protein